MGYEGSMPMGFDLDDQRSRVCPLDSIFFIGLQHQCQNQGKQFARQKPYSAQCSQGGCRNRSNTAQGEQTHQ